MAQSVESACNAGDLGLIPGLGRSTGEGNGNPLQYSCLEDPMDRGAWWATVHGVTESRTRLSDFHFHPYLLHSERTLRTEQMDGDHRTKRGGATGVGGRVTSLVGAKDMQDVRQKCTVGTWELRPGA